ncbi:hypothetical protein [Pseudochrobactrum sp. HB0163]|uniref:hypothetical protein n=1 Tax=Pseudochrobactrum sp. HB0163 TaxID=3450708 RepID=UPI003F6DB4EC
MAIKGDFTLGRLTLVAGSENFTTTGSALKMADVRSGDMLITQSGAVLVINTITGENSGTLCEPCPSLAAGANQPLRVRFQAEPSRLMAATRELIMQLGSGNVEAFSRLSGAADMVPVFTGAGAMALLSAAELGERAGGMKQGVYDPDGVKADAFDMAHMKESENALILTPDERSAIAQNSAERHEHDNKAVLDAATAPYTTEEKAKLLTVAENAAPTNVGTVGAALAAAAGEQTISDADAVAGVKSGTSAMRRWTWGSIKAGIKAMTDALYATAAQGAKADSAVQPAALAEKLGKTEQASDSAALGGKAAAQWQAEIDAAGNWPGVYTGSDPDEVNFPIGHYVVVPSSGKPPRNSTATIRLATENAIYTIGGSGPVLAGVWRQRGYFEYYNNLNLYQRVS